MTIKHFYITLMFLAAAIAAACSTADGVAKVDTDSAGNAVRGYDAVAFFSDNAAVAGNPAISYTWNGAKWLFATTDNLEKFKLNPDAYAPQFGGYCSYAVAHGYTADGDPNTWKVVDGKLYLNYNQNAKEAWEKEQNKFIEDGKQNWVQFQKHKPEHKG